MLLVYNPHMTLNFWDFHSTYKTALPTYFWCCLLQITTSENHNFRTVSVSFQVAFAQAASIEPELLTKLGLQHYVAIVTALQVAT